MPTGKFGDFSFSRFGFIVRTNTHRERERIKDAAKRFTLAIVGVSKDRFKIRSYQVKS